MFQLWDSIYKMFSNPSIQPTDIVDIVIVAYVIYKALVLIRDTRAMHLLKGIAILLVVTQVSYWTNLHAINYILKNTMQVGILAILIVFQPELRRALEQVGRSSFGKWFNFEEQGATAHKTQMIGEIARAAETLSKNKIGALIVIERESRIGEIIGTGININSDISAELLVNIFIPKTPLHDGAVVIREDKIQAAACFLPLSQNPNISKELGTRHRAGLGITEDSDAVVIIVSEETGRISMSKEGDLTTNLTAESLSKILTKLLEPEKDKKLKKNPFSRKEKQS